MQTLYHLSHQILLDGVKCCKINTTDRLPDRCPEAIFDKTVNKDPSEEVTFDLTLE